MLLLQLNLAKRTPQEDVTNTRDGERGTGNGERGTGNGERGTGNGERESGNECTAVTCLII